MADQLQLRGGTTTEHNTFTGASKEVTVDTTKKTAVVHDGSTAGGNPLMREDGSNSALALGSQGTPSLKFTGDTNTGIYSPGADQVAISTGGTGRLFISADGVATGGAAQSGFGGLQVRNNFIYVNEDGANTVQMYLRTTSSEPTIQVASNHPFLVKTNNQERLRITSDGKLGVGTSSPDARLHVKSSGTSSTIFRCNASDDVNLLQVYENSGGGGEVYVKDTSGASKVALLTSGSSYFTGGNVGIGTSSPETLLTLRNAEPTIRLTADANNLTQLQFGDTGDTVRGNIVFRNGTGGNDLCFHTNNNNEQARIDGSGRLLVGTSSTSVRARAILQGNSGGTVTSELFLAGDTGTPTGAMGNIYFSDNGHAAAAYISGQRDGGTWTSGSSQPSLLAFATTADGVATQTERMRIDSAGNVMFRTTSSSPFNNNSAFFNIGGYLGVNHINATVSGTGYVAFNYNAGEIGSITQNGTTAVAYNTTSDYRLKENVVSLTGATDRINQLQVRRFNFIAEPDRTVDGFIAHEVQEVVPEAITGEKDAVNEDGSIKPQGIDQSKLVPLLTAALQEALAKIETLEQRLNDAGIA